LGFPPISYMYSSSPFVLHALAISSSLTSSLQLYFIALYSLLHSVQTGSGAHPTYPIGTRGLFPRG
jgi:hypothetical protein